MGDHVCPWWLAYSFDNPLRRALHDPGALLGPYVSAGMTALDVGCGMGFFTLGLARLVGEQGAVIAIDLQPEMLERVARRAARAGLAGRIRLHRCAPDDLGVDACAGFALAFWMVHETPDAERFLRQVRARVAPGGKLLVAEPRGHVGARRFEEIVQAARRAGWVPCGAPPVRLSRSVLLERAPDGEGPGTRA